MDLLRSNSATTRRVYSEGFSFNPLKHVDPVMTIGLPLLIVVTNAMTGAHTIFGGQNLCRSILQTFDMMSGGVALMAISVAVNLVLAFSRYLILAKTGICVG